MSEPEWSLPMNRAELIARVEALEAALDWALARVPNLGEWTPRPDLLEILKASKVRIAQGSPMETKGDARWPQ